MAKLLNGLLIFHDSLSSSVADEEVFHSLQCLLLLKQILQQISYFCPYHDNVIDDATIETKHHAIREAQSLIFKSPTQSPANDNIVLIPHFRVQHREPKHLLYNLAKKYAYEFHLSNPFKSFPSQNIF